MFCNIVENTNVFPLLLSLHFPIRLHDVVLMHRDIFTFAFYISKHNVCLFSDIKSLYAAYQCPVLDQI